MECFNKENQKVSISAAAEEKINFLIKTFHIKSNESWGQDANNDNGIQDMHYTTNYEDLVCENFVVEGDNVIAYKYKEYTTLFDGSKEVTIHSWDDSRYGGCTDEIDKGYIIITKKEK